MITVITRSGANIKVGDINTCPACGKRVKYSVNQGAGRDGNNIKVGDTNPLPDILVLKDHVFKEPEFLPLSIRFLIAVCIVKTTMTIRP